MMLYVLTFMLGGFFGLMVMALMVCSGISCREEEEREQKSVEENKK